MRLYIYKHLNLLREIAIFQFKLKDQSSFFGFLWSFLNPLIMLTILFFFFRLNIGQEIKHYSVYLLIGLVHYTHFSNSTYSSMHVLVSMRQLTSNTIFPKELLVIGTVLSGLIELILSIFICILIAYFTGITLSWPVAFLPFVFILQVMLVLWISLILSCLYVFIRDINHIYNVFLRLLFFITPIFYDVSSLQIGIAKYIVFLNPLTYFINFSRALMIEAKPFSFKLFLLLTIINASLVYLSFRIFKKFETKIIEYV